ncbi:P-loop containing nucleoside triphosphate hydrolase protein [Gonapodya prolifera JEL478]|uniref:p-loop containing nucleoside triphosphate hydrolase protein n=1 Tax=Gonapodya prolifera (strain JEL478) TaxID=1344416 RepID=A0A139AGL8_GONPJ|nr:P-loop containing nucleoside triphosphate hydrolase protein [Gonapodya prolifera JEL478]|eukprot:KXS15946.1 P-loop containing nucleoside triphosphate hydrolase protein [Gonapodya prolifera JEL478]
MQTARQPASASAPSAHPLSHLLQDPLPTLDAIARSSASLTPPVPLPAQQSSSSTLDPHDTPDTTVCIRIRPLLPGEIARGCFSVVDPRNPNVHVHAPAASHKGPGAVRTTSFQADMAFGPDDDNESVYRNALRGMIALTLGGGVSTVMAYGQTGSGKTHTMTAMSQSIARDFFHEAIYRTQQDGEPPVSITADFQIHFSSFEIFGPNVFDLLSDRNPVQIAEDKFGSVQVRGTREEMASSSADVLALIELATSQRSTASTLKNDTSSRSHGVIRLRVVNTRVPEAEDGLMYLVDLAGSESAADVAEHSRERIAETKEINKSLAVLKDCIRNRALAALSPDKFVHIPYRTNRLTLLLKDLFELGSPRRCGTVVFACASPNVLDTSATLNTLRYIQPLRVPPPKPAQPSAPNPKNPSTWTNAYLRTWIARAYPAVDPNLLCPHESGRQILRLPEGDFLARCLRSPGVTPKRAKAVYIKLWGLLIDARTADRKKKLKERPNQAASDQMDREIHEIMTRETGLGRGASDFLRRSF